MGLTSGLFPNERAEYLKLKVSSIFLINVDGISAENILKFVSRYLVDYESTLYWGNNSLAHKATIY